MVSLFRKTSPDLYAGLTHFYDAILQLAKVYDWKEAVLRLAIEAHSHIVAQQPTDAKWWIIPAGLQGRVCAPMNMIGGALSNNFLVICELFNIGSCNRTGCERAHKCKGCGSKEHGLGNKRLSPPHQSTHGEFTRHTKKRLHTYGEGLHTGRVCTRGGYTNRVYIQRGEDLYKKGYTQKATFGKGLHGYAWKAVTH